MKPETFDLGGQTEADLAADAARLREELRSHSVRNLAPHSEKVLRDFTTAEAADFLRTTQNNLRKLLHDGKIQEPTGGTARARLYTAAEIEAIREVLARTSRNARLHMPRRRGDEHLQVLAFTTFKGGAGKTTTAAVVSEWLATRGYRVLAVDIDGQASLSTMFGFQPELAYEDQRTIYDVLTYSEDRLHISEVIQPTHFPNLDVAPGGLIVSEFETETPRALMEGEDEPFFVRLHNAIQSVNEHYDVVIIDCPPQLGFLTLSAMTAATGLVVPVVPNLIDVASLCQFLDMSSASLERIREGGFDFRYDFQRYLLTRFEPMDGPQAQVAGFLRALFGPRVMTAPFIKSTAVADAGLTNDTVIEVARGQIHRNTLARALESIDNFCGELERDMHVAWGREVE